MRTPSRRMQLSTISPAPRSVASRTQSSVRRPVSRRRFGRAGILLDAIVAVRLEAVDAEDDALAAEVAGELARSAPGRSSAGELIETLSAPASRQAAAWSRVRMPPATAKGMSMTRGDPPHPVEVEAAALGAGADVVEDQLVGALVAIAQRVLDDVADVAMVAELDALDDPAVPARRGRG